MSLTKSPEYTFENTESSTLIDVSLLNSFFITPHQGSHIHCKRDLLESLKPETEKLLISWMSTGFI